MKISARQYAAGLFAALEGQDAAGVKKVLKNFVERLARDRALSQAAAIIAAFQEIRDQAYGELSAELVSARDLGSAGKEMIIDYLKGRTRAKTVRLSEKTDPGLLGGFVLSYDSRVLDGSLRSSLASLKNKISN
ncbi:MAG: F0F1 ATP synthase subunit delta [Patescibacteria group bacterium]